MKFLCSVVALFLQWNHCSSGWAVYFLDLKASFLSVLLRMPLSWGFASDKTIDLYKWLGNLRVSDACYIELTKKEKSRLDRDDSDCSSTRVMSVNNTSRLPAVVILLSFPADDIYTYHFVYRYSRTIFLKFSVQKLFTFALVVLQITCIYRPGFLGIKKFRNTLLLVFIT